MTWPPPADSPSSLMYRLTMIFPGAVMRHMDHKPATDPITDDDVERICQDFPLRTEWDTISTPATHRDELITLGYLAINSGNIFVPPAIKHREYPEKLIHMIATYGPAWGPEVGSRLTPENPLMIWINGWTFDPIQQAAGTPLRTAVTLLLMSATSPGGRYARS